MNFLHRLSRIYLSYAWRRFSNLFSKIFDLRNTVNVRPNNQTTFTKLRLGLRADRANCYNVNTREPIEIQTTKLTSLVEHYNTKPISSWKRRWPIRRPNNVYTKFATGEFISRTSNIILRCNRTTVYYQNRKRKTAEGKFYNLVNEQSCSIESRSRSRPRQPPISIKA